MTALSCGNASYPIVGYHVQDDAYQSDKGYRNVVPRKSSNKCLKSAVRAACHLSGFIFRGSYSLHWSIYLGRSENMD